MSTSAPSCSFKALATATMRSSASGADSVSAGVMPVGLSPAQWRSTPRLTISRW
nr:hypothetical protein [uncultured Cohaesibacter sp.]